MTNYAKGRAGEYDLIKRFKAQGYEVLRTAGSHSPVDLIVFKDGELFFVQAKRGVKPSGSAVKSFLFYCASFHQMGKFLWRADKQAWRELT